LLRAQCSQSLPKEGVAAVVHDRADLAGEVGREDKVELGPREIAGLLGRGWKRRSRLRLRLPWSTERLVQQRLDRVEAGLVVGHRDLVTPGATAVLAVDRRPKVLVRARRRLEQHPADVVETRRGSLCEPRTHRRGIDHCAAVCRRRQGLLGDDGALYYALP